MKPYRGKTPSQENKELGGITVNKSLCKWSRQVNKMCPYEEMLNMIMNDVARKKIRCEGKQCLKILLKETGYTDEKEMMSARFSDLLKPHGPADSTNLLSNLDIEAVMEEFSRASIKKEPYYPNGPFYHIKFEMSDFMKSITSELRDIDFNKMKSTGFKTFGCVLNTDVWSGQGKHWVCIFGSFTKDKNDKELIDVEYFNSSGRPVDMYPTLLDWVDFKKKQGYNIKIRTVLPYQGVQESKTECGVWCLFYIQCRLEGKVPLYFIKKKTTDDHMIEGRGFLFV